MNSTINKRCSNPICGGNGNCAVCPKRGLEQPDSGAFEAVAEYAVSERDTANYDAVKTDSADGADSSAKNAYAIAIDLGTTTLAFALVDTTTGQVVHTITMLNSQRKYGADVLSRIQASVGGKKDELRACIQKDLCEGIDRLLQDYKASAKADTVDRIVISGNTTMIHLLMGYDCSALGVYPFTPVNTGLITGTAKEILDYTRSNKEIETTIFPCISAFVGGDIISGLYALDFEKKEDINLFVDLGTNGEIALGNSKKILATSVAAGPAFEGGNISCGMGSVAGAICSVDIESKAETGNYDVNVKTIQDCAPCGICGTGVIETVAEFLKNKIIDETGLYRDVFFEDGFELSEGVVFSQKDIREFQMAKAALRAGIEILITQYGVRTEDISKVYLAGGFGFHLDVKKAVVTGILPKELADKVEIAGNTALGGMVRFLTDREKIRNVRNILDLSQEIVLADNENFNTKYVQRMAFDVDL